MSILKNCILTIFLLVPTYSFSFEYQIEKKYLMAESTPGHEAVTSMAIECFLRSGVIEPTNCLDEKSVMGLLGKETVLNFPTIGDVTAQELLDASSWPDDPTRVSNSLSAGAKTFLANESRCHVRYAKTLWLVKRDHSTNITGGLFCNSHYGVLQFFHSMASKPMSYQSDESFDETLSKILTWATLTYDVAADKNDVLNQPYCTYFRSMKTDDEAKGMAEAFLPRPEVYGATLETEQFHCKDNFEVRFVFDNFCSNFFSSGNCTIINNDKKLQITALGALLHLVQDAYSTSHVDRGVIRDPNSINLVSCGKARGFFEYSKQDPDDHKSADVLPFKFGPECSSDGIDDVVTATAKVMWYLQQNTGEAPSDLISYLKTKVYGLAPADPDKIASGSI